MYNYQPEIRDRGFTLVELLFAIFIFGIVISSVYGSYRATFHIVQGSESRLNTANSARVVMERIAEDLSLIVAGPGGGLHGENHEYSGARGDSLSFVSSAHLVLKKTDTLSGHALIKYSVEVDEESSLLNLYRSDMVLLPGSDAEIEDSQKHILCQGLRDFSLTYLDVDGAEADEWLDDGGGLPKEKEGPVEPLLPTLVYVELKFAESMESESRTVFKTAVALPQRPKK